jgi:hypothetical protein
MGGTPQGKVLPIGGISPLGVVGFAGLSRGASLFDKGEGNGSEVWGQNDQLGAHAKIPSLDTGDGENHQTSYIPSFKTSAR